MGMWWTKIRHLFRRRAIREDLEAEMAAHLEFLVDEYIEAGLSEPEARQAARRRFGNELTTRRRAERAWHFPRFEAVLADVRYGLRGIRRAPAFSAVVLATLALGIGTTTAIFSVVYTQLLRPLPYPHAERLVWMGESAGQANGISVSWGNLLHWQASNRSLEAVSGFVWAEHTLTGEGEAKATQGLLVSHEFFRMMGWRPQQGRLLVPADDAPGAAPTVLLSYEFWTGALASDPDVLGRSVTLDDRAYEVVGVLPPGVRFLQRDTDYYISASHFFSATDDRARHGSVRALGLLREGLGAGEAKADLDRVMTRLALSDPGPETDHRAFVTPLATVERGEGGSTLWFFMAAVGMVLLLACANVASLILGRGVVRRREMAIRSAIGAGRVRLAGQMLTETLLIAVLGGVLGVLLAKLGLTLMVALAPAGLPRADRLLLDLPVLAFAGAVTMLAGLLAGTAPVLSQSPDVSAALKDGSSSAGVGRTGRSLRGGLVVSEVAITLVLAFGSALLLQSLVQAQRTDPGFDPAGLIAMDLRLPATRYPDESARHAFYERLTSELQAQNWVEHAAVIGCAPSRGSCGDWWYSVVGQPQPVESEVPVSNFDVADAGAFATLGMPLRAGREFLREDGVGGPVLVVNEAFAALWWATPGEAVGQAIKIGGPYRDGPTASIVGVVGDAGQAGPTAPTHPQFWMPFRWNSRSRMTVMVRVDSDVNAAMSAIGEVVADLDPALPVWSIHPFDETVSDTLHARRFNAGLLSVFALLAMVLAGVGVYGVLQQWVGGRRNEIALRMALGARKATIFRWVASHILRLVTLGLAFGALGAWVASRWLRGMVFEVSPQDPATLALAALGVVALAALAASLPLLRALSVDPAHDLERS